MNVPDRGSRKRMERASASSFSAQVPELVRVVRKSGFALAKLHELVMTRVVSDDDVELAESLNDELKPLIDALIHFALLEVERA